MIQFRGEYGIEVAIFIPHIYYLKTTGQLNGRKIITYKGMEPYYFFLDKNEIEFTSEECRYHNIEQYPGFPDYFRDGDSVFKCSHLDEFIPPDYYNFYKSYKLDYIPRLFHISKPLLLINNKYNIEWYTFMPPQNFFSIDELRKMLQLLIPHYTIVYVRTNDLRLKNYSIDHGETHPTPEFKDREMIKHEFNEVLLFENIIEEYNISCNELKCMLNARAVATISVLGGINFFDAYFPSKHIMYCKFRPDVNPYLAQPYYQQMHNILCPKNNSELFFANREDQLMSYIQTLIPQIN